MLTPDQIRTEITNKIVTALETGVRPWGRSWAVGSNGGLPCNFVSKRKYTGINAVILMLQSMMMQYDSKYWGTADSWLKQIGCHVKKGEKATGVILYKRFQPKDRVTGKLQVTATGKPKFIYMMRQYPIFNVDQFMAPTTETLLGVPRAFTILGQLLGDQTKSRSEPVTSAELMKIAQKFLPANKQPDLKWTRERIAKFIHNGIDEKLATFAPTAKVMNDEPDFEFAETFLQATGAKIVHRGNRACYVPAQDLIRMPSKKSFFTMADYYQTASHELAHWTEQKDRVGQKPEHNYAWGELVAEISSCFTIMGIGVQLSDKMLEKSEGYLDFWLKGMKENNKFIFEAASWASKVTDYLLAFVGLQNPEYVSDDTSSDDVDEASDEEDEIDKRAA